MNIAPRFVRCCVTIAVAALLSAGPARAQLAAIRIPVSASVFSGLTRITVSVKEENGTQASYSGVSLGDVLVAAGAPKGAGIRGAALASYVLIRASDGYRAVFALPELDAAFTERVVLLADQRNGAPLPHDLGPYRIVVPGEGRHARWVHSVTEIDLLPIP